MKKEKQMRKGKQKNQGSPLDGSWLLDMSSKQWKNAFTAKIQKLATRWVKCGFISQRAADSIVSDFSKNYPDFHIPRTATHAVKAQKPTKKIQTASVIPVVKRGRGRPRKTEQPTTIATPSTPGTVTPPAQPITTKRPRGRPRKYNTAPQMAPQKVTTEVKPSTQATPEASAQAK